jgi:hypothetical protein
VISFNELVEGGMPAKWKVLLDVALDSIIQNELIGDKEINKFFKDLLNANKKYYPNLSKGLELLNEMKNRVFT